MGEEIGTEIAERGMKLHSSVSCRSDTRRFACIAQDCADTSGKRRMWSGIFISTVHPESVTCVRASQFSSQFSAVCVSLKRSVSTSTPDAFTRNSYALLPSPRVPSAIDTQSDSTSRPRRVRRGTIAERTCSQSKATYTASSS